MFIQTESTPNPASLKFIPGGEVMADGVADFRTAEEAAVSPLARRLFEIDGVEGVFFGADFIAVTKGAGEWQHLKPPVLGAIMEHFTSGAPLFDKGSDAAAPEEGESDNDEVVTQIKELLDTRIRPAVAQDGGDIAFHSFREGTVYLHMRGACAGCPASTMTLKQGIENMLRHYVPEVETVEPIL
ncbi:MAG: NifU family protein [Alphaproteobacteria bacterium]